MVPHQSISALANPSAAALNSSWLEMVSSHSTSAPPAFSPSAVASNIAAASACDKGPTGCMMSPVGPTDPATMTWRPDASATSRPSSAAMRLSSNTRSSALCNFRRDAFAPNELVKNRSDPASTAPLYRALMFSGFSAFQISGASPAINPMLNRFVPVAPSANKAPLSFSIWVNRLVIELPFKRYSSRMSRALDQIQFIIFI